MNSLVGLHRYRNQQRRQNRLRRQRDGMTNHDHTFENMPRQEINDFLSRLQEIQENRRRIKWTPKGPAEQQKFAAILRRVRFNQYEDN